MLTYYQILYNQNTNSKQFFNSLKNELLTMYSYSFYNTFQNQSLQFLLYSFIVNSVTSEKKSSVSFVTYQCLQNANVFETTLPIMELYKRVEYKFTTYKHIATNPFMSLQTVTEFMNKFCDAQRIYWILNRLVIKYKYKKTPTHITQDLYLNPISADDRNTIPVIQNRKKYLFTVQDILRIIHTAITNSHFLESNIQVVKNPYTNLPFTKADLYNFYFFVERRYIRVPELFYQFFRCDFCLYDFGIKNYQILQDTHFKNVRENCSKQYLVSQIRNMFKYVDYNRQNFNKIIVIDVNFPDDTLIDIMYPYLMLHLKHLFHLNSEVRYISQKELEIRLREFYNFNPFFGRKYISGRKSGVQFNTNHIPFKKHVVPTIPFQMSHLIHDIEDQYESANAVLNLSQSTESESDGEESINIFHSGLERELELELEREMEMETDSVS